VVAGVEFPREESRRGFEDRDVFTEPLVLGLETADLRMLLVGRRD
jgi:hypothetical protein